MWSNRFLCELRPTVSSIKKPLIHLFGGWSPVSQTNLNSLHGPVPCDEIWTETLCRFNPLTGFAPAAALTNHKRTFHSNKLGAERQSCRASICFTSAFMEGRGEEDKSDFPSAGWQAAAGLDMKSPTAGGDREGGRGWRWTQPHQPASFHSLWIMSAVLYPPSLQTNVLTLLL